MSADRLRQILIDCCNDVTFSVNGVSCGIFPSVDDSKATYSAWYGDQNKLFYDVDDLMSSDFFGGIALNDIASKIEYQAY